MWEPAVPRKVRATTERLARTPTICSLAARYRFDAQVCHVRFLQHFDERVIPSYHAENAEAESAMKRMKTPVARVGFSRPSTSSTSASSRRRRYALHLGYRDADDAELGEILQRVSRPTSASLGARNLAGKRYDYYTPKATKTYPLLPELETKFMGRRRPPVDEYDAMLDRLCRPTKSSSYKLKGTPDPNDRPVKYINECRST